MNKPIVFLALAILICTSTPYWKVSPTVPANTDETPVAEVYVEPEPTPANAQPLGTMKEKTYTVVGNANIRACRSTDCAIVGYLYEGDEVTANCVGDWCQLEIGFVYSPCLGFPGTCK